ncbi:unnamed protein product [Heligmosomoides polygyrus]|uniref:DUF1899 domain-containing protein n=1 Tax=Heligmosomoides polygyrus TaxID=6339 RepID=A0A183GSP7_HELPZ|nr:unnamed protein product [Heligmosomoides polygyrus]
MVRSARDGNIASSCAPAGFDYLRLPPPGNTVLNICRVACPPLSGFGDVQKRTHHQVEDNAERDVEKAFFPGVGRIRASLRPYGGGAVAVLSPAATDFAFVDHGTSCLFITVPDSPAVITDEG